MTASSSRDEALKRAVCIFDSIHSARRYSRETRLFGSRRWWMFGRAYEDLWPFADAWSAICTLSSLPEQHRARQHLGTMLSALVRYSSDPEILTSRSAGFESVVAPPLGAGGDRYYDDNAWLGLALVRHSELSVSIPLLQLAQRVFAFVVSGWSTEDWHIPGGIRWKEPAANRSRNACANGPAAELAALLFEKTGSELYLDWATRIYEWTRLALLTSEGLYVDRIAPDGSLEQSIWSYNQGSMIGAGSLLYQQTGDLAYLDQAVVTANAYVGSRGVAELLGQDPVFNAVLFRNLLVLHTLRPDDRYGTLMADYGKSMWKCKHLRHGQFAGNGSALNNSSAMLQIYALMAGATPHA